MIAPSASSPEVLRRMQRQRRRDTQPELALRSQLHRLGLRFRVDHTTAPTVRGRADIVFGPTKVAVFVDGCFWHMCPVHNSLPRANADWWVEKLARNVSRDRNTDHQLREAAWLPVRVWEHEDMIAAARKIQVIVLRRRASRT